MLSRSEAQRQKGDELRMRAAGIDPTKIDEQWLGEVMSRRQKKEAKVDEDVEKEKRLAAELPMEKSEVVSKKPEGRLTWLHKALVLAAKGRIPVPQIYNIIQSSKFTSGVSSKVGLKMKGLVSANLHLFKKEQQKSLQSGRLMDFSKDGSSGSEEEKKKSKKRKHSDSYSASSHSRHSRSRSRSSSRRSDSRKKKKKRKKEKDKEKEKEKDRSRSHDDRSHEKKDKEREKEKERDRDSDDAVKKKKKDKTKDKKEEKAAKEEKAHKEKNKEEKSKKDKSHKEDKVKEKAGKEDRKASKAAKEAAAKLAAAEEELAKAREEEEQEEDEPQEVPEAAVSSYNFQDASQLDERFPPSAQAAGAMGSVKMKLSGWKPACLRM